MSRITRKRVVLYLAITALVITAVGLFLPFIGYIVTGGILLISLGASIFGRPPHDADGQNVKHSRIAITITALVSALFVAGAIGHIVDPLRLAAAPVAAVSVTDPSGSTCSSLDSQGYCPGDDPATSAPAPSAAPAVDPLTAWCSGPAGTAEQAVSGDIGQIATDGGAGNVSAVEADGSQLFTDASAAGKALPPTLTNTQTLDYGRPVGYDREARYNLSNGNFTTASTDMGKSNTFIKDDSAVMPLCG